ncbi:MAG: hypothetical protein V3S72_04045 [Desulfobacterales bacterium]
MSLKPDDIEDIRLLFEDALKRIQKIEKIERIKIRGRIRRELNKIVGWKNQTPDRILRRWDSRLSDVFSLLPYFFRDDLQKLLSIKIKKRK